MTSGDPSSFAIELGVTQRSVHNRHTLTLGFFVLHVRGVRYGVHSPDATALGCSLDEVRRRVAYKGRHVASFARERAAEIADAFRLAVYAPDQELASYFGMSRAEFSKVLYGQHIVWAPDGDEAFDDGSFVLHFDLDDQVRVIAFRSIAGAYRHDPETLRDVEMPATKFYSILEDLSRAYDYMIKSMQKTAEPGATDNPDDAQRLR
jgi:hypothetical protein